jgi:hypothetical protein
VAPIATDINPVPKRRWLAFRLRTLFVLVTVVAGAFGWVGHQFHWIRQRQAMCASGQWVGYDPCAPAAPAPSLLWMFGERGYGVNFRLR